MTKELAIVEVLHRDLMADMVRELNEEEKEIERLKDEGRVRQTKELEEKQNVLLHWAMRLGELWHKRVIAVEVCGEVERKFRLVEEVA